MPRKGKLPLGRTGSKHKNKKRKVETEEAEDEEMEVVPPRELVFEDAIHFGVREALDELVELVELRLASAFSAAYSEMIQEAARYNAISFAMRELPDHGLALQGSWVRWVKSRDKVLAARVWPPCVLRGFADRGRPGFCLLSREECVCATLCQPCSKPQAQPLFCLLWEPGMSDVWTRARLGSGDERGKFAPLALRRSGSS